MPVQLFVVLFCCMSLPNKERAAVRCAARISLSLVGAGRAAERVARAVAEGAFLGFWRRILAAHP